MYFPHTTNEQLETKFVKDAIKNSSQKVIFMYKSNKNVWESVC